MTRNEEDTDGRRLRQFMYRQTDYNNVWNLLCLCAIKSWQCIGLLMTELGCTRDEERVLHV